MYTLLAGWFDSVVGFFHLFSYITVRCGVSFMFAFLLSLLCFPKYIEFSHKWQKKGQPIRDASFFLQSHEKKKGTPTVGGLITIVSVLLSCVLFGDLRNYYIIMLMVSIIGFGFIGFLDDYFKIKKESPAGISAKLKFLLQILLAVAIVLSANYFINTPSYSNTLTFPFFRKFVLELGVLYTIFRVFVIVGSSNAVNLTDGLDGLAIVPVLLIGMVFTIFSYIIGNINLAQYLYFNYQNGAQEMCIFLSALVGGCLGFLWYNVRPAQIFMGDTGSLAFGGTLGAVSVLIKSEFLLAIAGFLFVIETLSVIIQVNYYKITNGKRIFKMTPLHHHFEKSGWSEEQVVVRFWIISIIFTMIALSSLKIR